jgi:hypothetical protein
MSQRSIGLALISFGIAVLFFAFNMSVSVEGSRIVNLHMLSERQNYLGFGGIAFLAGIILFALGKSGQSEESAARERWRKHEKASRRVILVEAAIGSKLASFRHLFVGLEEGFGSIAIRLFVGLFCGFVIALSVSYPVSDILDLIDAKVSGGTADFWAGLTVLFSVLYALRTGPMRVALRRVLIIGLVFLTVSSVVHFLADKPVRAKRHAKLCESGKSLLANPDISPADKVDLQRQQDSFCR